MHYDTRRLQPHSQAHRAVPAFGHPLNLWISHLIFELPLKKRTLFAPGTVKWSSTIRIYRGPPTVTSALHHVFIDAAHHSHLEAQCLPEAQAAANAYRLPVNK